MKHRLFIAVSLPEPTRQEVISLQSRLEKLSLPLRSEDPEKLHITLNFLGRIEADQIPSINKIISRVSILYNPFTLVPGFLDAMYKKHSDSYIYLGLAGDSQVLKDMYRSLSQSLSQLSLPQPLKFFPHITIARFIKADPVTIKSAMDKVSDFELPPMSGFTVDRLSLYESFLSHKGSHFRLIGQFTLK